LRSGKLRPQQTIEVEKCSLCGGDPFKKLAHVERNAIKGAYNRAEHLSERTKMQARRSRCPGWAFRYDRTFLEVFLAEGVAFT
jgi:hypothetical protein